MCVCACVHSLRLLVHPPPKTNTTTIYPATIYNRSVLYIYIHTHTHLIHCTLLDTSNNHPERVFFSFTRRRDLRRVDRLYARGPPPIGVIIIIIIIIIVIIHAHAHTRYIIHSVTACVLGAVKHIYNASAGQKKMIIIKRVSRKWTKFFVSSSFFYTRFSRPLRIRRERACITRTRQEIRALRARQALWCYAFCPSAGHSIRELFTPHARRSKTVFTLDVRAPSPST